MPPKAAARPGRAVASGSGFNERRPHSSLDGRALGEVYTGSAGGIGNNRITPYLGRQPVQRMGAISPVINFLDRDDLDFWSNL